MMLALGASGAWWTAAPAYAASAQPERAPATTPQEHAASPEAAPHEGGLSWTLVARLFNFAVMAGTLVYFLRSPFMAFLSKRSEEIRAALVEAAALEKKSTAQLADLDRRLAALPGEIEAMRSRGMEDVAAEEARIRSAAEADRARLIEQARRRIDLQLRVARRELTAAAADLAVAVATERIRKTIRDDDQTRLLDAYMTRLKAVPAGVAGSGPGQPGGGRP